MKKFGLVFVLLCISVLLLGAAFAPLKFARKTFTKSVKYSMRGLNGVTVLAFGNISAKLNGKGESWPFAANTAQDLSKFRNVSTVTFYGTSTAAASAKVIKVQEY